MRHVAVVAHQDKLRQKTKRALKDALREAGHEVLWLTIEKGRQAKKMARQARKEGAEVVIVAGGDGSVRAAAEGLVHTGTPMAVLPAGTANLFASAMGLPKDPAEVVALVGSGQVRTIDTGTCNDLTFNVMGGAGFDAAMIDAADADKERLGVLAYFRAGAQAARSRHAFQLSVTLDGARVFHGSATGVLVGNLGTLKGGLEAFPDASPTDGVLDLAVITAAGVRDWAALMLAAARHRQHATSHAHLWQGREIRVEFSSKHRFELDGGVRGRAKQLDFVVQPQSLTLCAPVA